MSKIQIVLPSLVDALGIIATEVVNAENAVATRTRLWSEKKNLVGDSSACCCKGGNEEE